MDSDVTYADLKFPTNNQTAGKETGKTNISQKQNKTLTTKIMIASVFVICFLLFSTLIALIILYSRALSKSSLSEKQMEELQYHYNKTLEYVRCKNRTSGNHCGQYFQLICPAHWELNNSRCYYFSQQKESWEKSQSDCKARQADLVIIDDRMKQTFIMHTKHDGFFWIGLTDREKKAQWKWVNGASLETEKFWNCNQPDNFDDKEHCATVGSPTGQCGDMNDWNDDECGKKLYYICEMEAEDKKMDFTLPASK